MDGDPNRLLAAWLGSLSHRTENTRRTYDGQVRAFVAWCAANSLTVETVQKSDVARYVYEARQRRGSGSQPARRTDYGANVRRFYGWLCANGYLENDPTKDVIAVEQRRVTRTRFVSLDELRRLIAASLADPVDAGIVLLLGVMGLTVNELHVAQVSDYERRATGASLRVQRGGSWVTVDLPSLVVEVLDRVVAGRTRGPLFTSNRDNPADKAVLRRVLLRVAAEAGINPAPSARDLALSTRYIAASQGFSFLEVLATVPGRRLDHLIDAANGLPPPRRPPAFRLAALVRPDHDSDAALLDQADALAFSDAHPAVRVMLVGAVLERHMRSLALQKQALDRPPTKPDGTGITSWTGPLTGLGVLSREDSADCQFIADRRNEAAHGHFELLTADIADVVTERAKLLLQKHPTAPLRPLAAVVPTPVGDDSATAKRQRKQLRKVEATPRLRREKISQKVQLFVWQRDAGRCVDCGSKEAIEFDHIIPLALGGSNTARNLQLLCEGCNRRKGATLS